MVEWRQSIMTEDKIRLPSGRVVDNNALTGGQWKECLYAARILSAKKGVDMAEIGYWEKYAEFTTGLQKNQLESFEADDYEYLIKRLMDIKKAGPKGPRETEKKIKN